MVSFYRRRQCKALCIRRHGRSTLDRSSFVSGIVSTTLPFLFPSVVVVDMSIDSYQRFCVMWWENLILHFWAHNELYKLLFFLVPPLSFPLARWDRDEIFELKYLSKFKLNKQIIISILFKKYHHNFTVKYCQSVMRM